MLSCSPPSYSLPDSPDDTISHLINPLFHDSLSIVSKSLASVNLSFVHTVSELSTSWPIVSTISFNTNKLSQQEKVLHQPLFPRPGTPIPSHHQLTQSAPVVIPNGKRAAKVIDNSPEDESINIFEPTRRRSKSFNQIEEKAGSSSPDLIGPFVGSFQESLLSGHMSNTPSTTFHGFIADLGVCGQNIVPPHAKIPFSAVYYHVDHETPYVGTITLDKKGYKVPPKGIIQLVIINPSLTPTKTFLVKYDLTDMPPLTKTFLRQKVMNSTHPILRYAVHLKFASPKKKKYYLYKNIRVVFAHRSPDDPESLTVTYDYPEEPKYFSYKTKSSP